MVTNALDIFISYSVTDKVFVERLAADIKAHDMTPWVGHINIRGGDEWPDAIEKAIDRAHVVLVVWSPEARNSKYVRKEYGYAIEHNKRVVPLVLKTCELTMLLQGLHWLDFTQSESYESQFTSLIDLLKNRDTIPLPHSSTRPRHVIIIFVLSVIFLVVMLGVGLSYGLNRGAKLAPVHAAPVSTATMTTTSSTTITIGGAGTAVATGIAGATSAPSTPKTGQGTSPTQAASSPAVVPTNAPTATPSPTIGPTADPTRSPQ